MAGADFEKILCGEREQQMNREGRVGADFENVFAKKVDEVKI